ncbi:hypothetical protein ON010_g14671 [Phytophthora cinnamomi]|nr:hypothetical protein ON010_g14671 [Phytophthora cinnamomi]
MRLRILCAWLISLRKKACSSTPGSPKVSGRDAAGQHQRVVLDVVLAVAVGVADGRLHLEQLLLGVHVLHIGQVEVSFVTEHAVTQRLDDGAELERAHGRAGQQRRVQECCVIVDISAYVALGDDHEVHAPADGLLDVHEVLAALREHLIAGPARAHDDELEVLRVLVLVRTRVQGRRGALPPGRTGAASCGGGAGELAGQHLDGLVT